MKIDTHVLFLILIVGIISLGLVGANVLNNDQSMKQEVFDGIKISVPADSNFVKVGEGVYKDSGYGITINTFKNNDSMIKFLKNTKNSKVIPIENQPPQSVAFKKGDTINILVTNGNEGVAVSSKDAELTTKIANNVVFNDNHKTQKPVPLNIIHPPMDPHNDFNLILLLVAKVDTNIFNVGIVENNLVLVAEDYNAYIEQGDINLGSDVSSVDNSVDSNILSGNSQNSLNDNVSTSIINGSSNNNANSSLYDDMSSSNDSEVIAALADDSSANTNEPTSPATTSASSTTPASTSSSASPAAPASTSSPSSSPSSAAAPSSSSSSSPSTSSSSNSNPSKYTYDDCKKLVEQSLPSTLSIDESSTTGSNHEQSGNSYVFHIKDNQNKDVGVILVDFVTGKIDDSGLKYN